MGYHLAIFSNHTHAARFLALFLLPLLFACTPAWQDPIPLEQVDISHGSKSLSRDGVTVTVVVSYAGAVWGSPLADAADEKQLRWLTHIPGAECEKKDSKALETLSPANREAWFAQHTLPEHIRYYSVIAFPDPDNISNGLQRTHKQLGAMKDARNDSQVVFYDQVIPGSTILGFFNADHWAMSVPIARQHEIVQTLFADQNDFPREIALEAILRYIEEDLDTDAHRAISE